MKNRHICDEGCICPRCGGDLLYAGSLDSHACPDRDCRWRETTAGGLSDAMAMHAAGGGGSD